MTNYEVGRELDAMVQESVMGATWHGPVEGNTDFECLRRPGRHGGAISYRSPVYAVRGPFESGESIQVWAECPQYSSDVAAAFDVVKAMGAQGFALTLNISPNRFVLADFDHLEGEWTRDAIGDSAPHAICKAALFALRALRSIDGVSERREGTNG